jgi:quinol monooxygenase YgiN
MKCKEVAVFKFKEDSLEGAVELNKKLISEMQMESNNTLLDFEIYQSPKDPCIFTWLIDWTDSKSAKETTDKWLSFPSNKKFSSSVENDIFYDFLEKR